MGTATLVQQLIATLRDQDATLGLAESCTGGLLSAEIVKQPGVSAVYRGGVVSYDNRVKDVVLKVSRALLATHGAVSLSVAREMAKGARELLDVDWACSITGIAGPDGGSEKKPVGTVCFAVVGPGFDRTIERHFSGDRQEIQRQSVDCALELLIESLTGIPDAAEHV